MRLTVGVGNTISHLSTARLPHRSPPPTAPWRFPVRRGKHVGSGPCRVWQRRLQVLDLLLDAARGKRSGWKWGRVGSAVALSLGVGAQRDGRTRSHPRVVLWYCLCLASRRYLARFTLRIKVYSPSAAVLMIGLSEGPGSCTPGTSKAAPADF